MVRNLEDGSCDVRIPAQLASRLRFLAEACGMGVDDYLISLATIDAGVEDDSVPQNTDDHAG